jgi:prolyl oligopeptidase
MRYPFTRIDDLNDVLDGMSFADPYRWLEGNSGEVREWQRTQAQLASAHVREWPHFERLRELVEQFSTERFVALPRYAGGRWFRKQVAQVVVADEPMGEGRVLFDALAEHPEWPPVISWIAPSLDGCTLALGLCVDGSENNTIHLVDVATGRRLEDAPNQTLMDERTGGAHWLPDSSGFFFTAIHGAAVDFKQQIYLHRRAPQPSTVAIDGIAWTEAKDYRMIVVSRDGRHAVAIERQRKPVPIAVATLEASGESPLRWRPFVTDVAGTLAGHVIGDQYIAVTDIGAPRGRLVAIDLHDRDPNNSRHWRELVRESEAVLRTVTPVGEWLYLTEFVDTYSRVRIVDRQGRACGQVPLPRLAAINELPIPIMNLPPRGHPRKFVFAFSSLTVSPGLYSHAPGEAKVEVLREPQARLKDVVVEDRTAVSADGTRVPYRIVRRSDVNAEQPQPTLIYGYGGFNVACSPQFPGAMAAFVAVGGVYVHSHLRGGAEFGREWWQSGRMARKQNCYHDLYAIAEDLICAKRSTPERLAVTGGSNGGLMAGVALTQRPDLWKVVIPRVAVLDLIGACREPYSRQYVTEEFADIAHSNEVQRLASFSPYQLVRDGVRYPAVFLEAGDTDPRCPAWHARKFAARLQWATAGNAPILLHVWENAGHGPATSKSVAVTQATEWLAFTMRHLGVEGWI